MLPSTVFYAEAFRKDKKYEISAADVFADGFTFRVPDEWHADFGMPFEGFRFIIFDRGERNYDSIPVTDFTLEETEKGLFRFRTKDGAFIKRYRRLLSEYLEYINIKLETDESDLLEAVTGRGYGRSFSAEAAEWRRKMLASAGKWGGRPDDCEIAVCLDEPAKWNNPSDFWRLTGLEGHPVSGLQVTHAYIGSPCCPRLFPDEGELSRLLEWCEREKIKPVFCFPPMPERETDTYLERVKKLPSGAELEINDTGTALMLKGRGFHLTAGAFLNRRRKDPRMNMRIHSEQDAEASRINNMNADFYREYLEGLGFERFTYEAAGLPQEINGRGNVLYLPLYRVNTSLFCPLAKALGTEETGGCPMHCLEKACFYPDDMKLIGRFNSLFGFSGAELNDAELLNGYINAGIGRLAVRI